MILSFSRFATAFMIAIVSATPGSTGLVSSLPPRDLSGALAHHAPAPGVTAFVHVSVVPMDTDRVLSDQTVLVQGSQIIALGPAATVSIPNGAQQIDGRGKYLLPGLADMHAHVAISRHIGSVFSGQFGMMLPAASGEADSAAAETRLFLWLANGATTIRNVDFQSAPQAQYALRLRARSAAGTAWFPHIYTAGPWAPEQYLGPQNGGGGPVRLDSVAAYVAAYKAAGFDFIKVHDEAPDVLDSVLAAARRVGIPVSGHVPPPVTIEHILPLGYASIEHPLTEYVWAGHEAYAKDAKDTAGVGVLAAAIQHAGVWHCVTQSHYDRWHNYHTKLANVEQRAGVRLLLGTDEIPWVGLITRELQSFVEAGLTPYQALLTGTRNVAEYLGTAKESGTIAVGKRADLVLLTGNPLQDVRYTAQPAGVMVNGRWLSRAEIDQHLAHATFPTFTSWDGTLELAPIKSYWTNASDELEESALVLFGDAYAGESVPENLKAVRTTYLAKLHALVDSLGTSDQYATGTQRMVQLVAKQLGETRTLLTPSDQTAFDERAKVWIQERTAAGNSVTIAGVPR